MRFGRYLVNVFFGRNEQCFYSLSLSPLTMLFRIMLCTILCFSLFPSLSPFTILVVWIQLTVTIHFVTEFSSAIRSVHTLFPLWIVHLFIPLISSLPAYLPSLSSLCLWRPLIFAFLSAIQCKIWKKQKRYEKTNVIMSEMSSRLIFHVNKFSIRNLNQFFFVSLSLSPLSIVCCFKTFTSQPYCQPYAIYEYGFPQIFSLFLSHTPKTLMTIL